MLNLVITLVMVLLCFIHKGHVRNIHSKVLMDRDVVIGCQDDRTAISSCVSIEWSMPAGHTGENMS